MAAASDSKDHLLGKPLRGLSVLQSLHAKEAPFLFFKKASSEELDFSPGSLSTNKIILPTPL